MKKVLLIIFTLLILTTNLCAWDDTDREIGIWIDQIREYQRESHNIKIVSREEFLKNNFPETYKEIKKNIKNGNYTEAKELADKLAMTLEIGYENEPYFDGEKLFGINEMIEKQKRGLQR